MTSVEMQREFDNKFRMINKLSEESLSSNEVEMFLNNAQEELYRSYSKTFEGEEFSRIVLMKLYKIRTYLGNDPSMFQNGTNLSGGIYFELPTDYKLPTNIEEVTMTKVINNVTVTKSPRVKPITDLHYNLNENSQNPYKNPYDEMVWRIDYGVNNTGQPSKVHQVILPTGWTFVKYNLHYLRYALNISITSNNTCELDKTVHPELVDKAVELASKALQIKKQILK